jgi:hypothetical protein
MTAIYQAIQTKYIGPTNTRGSRVKATAEAGSVTLSWDDALNATDNHRAAAEALANKRGWISNGARLVGGCIGGPGYVWTVVDADPAHDALLKLATLPTQSPEMFDNPSVRVAIYSAIELGRMLAADAARR